MISNSWRRWLKKTTQESRRRRPLRHGSCGAALGLELLEDRCLLATGLSGLSYGQVPLGFESNDGQTDSEVDYLARGSGYTLFLSEGDAVLRLQRPGADAASQSGLPNENIIHMQLVGRNSNPVPVSFNELESRSNYIIGNDPSKWHTNIANFGSVKYMNVYAGVDVVYYGNQRQLEYDFVVAPGASPDAIRLSFAGVESLSLDEVGNLILHTEGGELVEKAPVVYQEAEAGKLSISGQYVIDADNTVRFAVGDYDTSRTLVIDPLLSYSTYLGGIGADRGNAIAVDSFGNAYVTGATSSANFPVAAPTLQGTRTGQYDIFVAKFNASGTGLIYSTYLGGSANDVGTGVAVNSSGVAFLTGYTNSTDFPPTDFPAGSPIRPFGGGNNDAFIAALTADGTKLSYFTYLGGKGDDLGFAIGIDGANNAYITGSTTSTDFPITAGAGQSAISFSNAFRSIDSGATWAGTNNGLPDSTVVAFATDPTLANTFYAATFNGGVFQTNNSGATWTALNTGLTNLNVSAVAVDSTGNIYAGTAGGGVFKFAKGGSTWLATNNGLTNLNVRALTIDPAGNIYAGTAAGVFKSTNGAASWTSTTSSLNVPDVNVLASTATAVYAGTAGGGVFRSTDSGATWTAIDNGLLHLNITSLVVDPSSASTLYLGTPGDGVFKTTNGGDTWSSTGFATLLVPSVTALAAKTGGVVLAGTNAGIFRSADGGASWALANSGITNLSVTALAFDTGASTNVFFGARQTTDAFVAKVTNAGALSYATFLGGSRDQQGHGIAVDPSGVVAVAGHTTSLDFPVTPVSPTPLTAFQTFNADVKLFKTTDSGGNWAVSEGAGGTSLARGSLLALAIDKVTPSTLYASVFGSGIFKSIDNGVSWTPANVGLTNFQVSALEVDPTSSLIVYAGTTGGGIFKSVNGGGTWAAANTGLTNLTITALAVHPTTPSILYAGTSGGGVFKSTNSAGSWVASNTNLTNLFVTEVAIDPTAPTNVLLGTQGDGVFRSINSGLSWSQSNRELPGSDLANPTINITAMDFSIGGEAYIGVNNGTGLSVFRSGDGGSSWVATVSGLTNPNITVIATDPISNLIVYAGTSNGGIFRSIDGGNNWTAVNGATDLSVSTNRLTNFQVASLAIHPTTSTIVYAGFEQGLIPTADAFVTQVNPTGTGYLYSTYIGGNVDDVAQGIALDTKGLAYITGYTNSGAYPILFPLLNQNLIHPGGTFGYDAFITKLSTVTASSSAVTVVGANTITPLSMNRILVGTSLVVDTGANSETVVVTAITATTFTASFTKTHAAGFVIQFAAESKLQYSTFYGGGITASAPPLKSPQGDDYGNSIVVDGDGFASVAGNTTSIDFPVTDTAFQSSFGGGINQGDAFIVRVNATPAIDFTGGAFPNGLPADFASYYGGNGDDSGNGIAVDQTGNLYITGFTGSTNLSLVNPALGAPGGNISGGLTIDGFAAKITPIPTQSKLNVEVSPSALGDELVDVTLTAIVTTPSTVPFGTAYVVDTFFDGNRELGRGVSDGKGNLVLIARGLPATSEHQFYFYFSGDKNHLPSKSATINMAPTATQLTSSGAGPSPTFTATVRPTSTTGTPTGYVTFMVNGTILPGQPTINPPLPGLGGVPGYPPQFGVPLVNGVATYGSLLPLTPGSYLVTAIYSGDLSFLPSTSTVLSQTANQTATVASLQAVPTSTVFGQNTTLTAIISPLTPGVGFPSGNVIFKDSGVDLGTVQLGATGLAILTTNKLSAGDHSIIAFYSGASTFSTSSSAPLAFTVGKATPSVALTATPTPPQIGQALTLNAKVTAAPPGSGLPTGTVTFMDGLANLGTVFLDNTGSASLQLVAPLTPGDHSFTATYNGDVNFQIGTSAPLTLGSSITQLVAQPTTTNFGQVIAFQATVIAAPPSTGIPTGTVNIMDGAIKVGTGTLLGGTTLPPILVNTLTVGQHNVTAVYVGDGFYAGSTSAILPITVNKASVQFTLIISAPSTPPEFGQPVQITASVVGDSFILSKPTGSVSIFDGLTPLGTGNLTNGVFSLSTQAFTVGTHTLTASYTGDNIFQAASTAPQLLTVAQASTTTLVDSSANPSNPGQPVTITATVTANQSVPVQPTGTATFFDGVNQLATVALNAGASASITTSTLAFGDHNFTVSYSGDGNFAPSTSRILMQRVALATSVALASSVNPSSVRQPVTFTATLTPGQGGPAPTGTVTFFEGTTALGTSAVSGNVANFTTSALSVGEHRITATYSGDSNYSTTSSAALTQKVEIISLFATGADAGGGPNVIVYNALNNAVKFNFFAYDPAFTGGVRVAIGDVTGDGTPDIITAPGPGGGPDIHVYSGVNGQLVRQFFAFDPRFTGGQYVAAGDVNADGFAEIIVGADKGGGPNVTIFNGKDSAMLGSFFPYDPRFTGGVRVAAGDVDGDGRAETITAAGPGGGPNVAVFAGVNGAVLDSFFAFNPFFSNGLFVSAGDLDGDRIDEIVVGIDAGSNPTVAVYDGIGGAQLAAFFAYDQNFAGGVRVGTRLNRAGFADILTSPGPGGGPDVRVFSGVNDALVEQFFAYSPLFTGGLFVAGGH